MDTKKLADSYAIIRQEAMATAPKLGERVRDIVSGFVGIVECRAEWLNGCVRLTVAPDVLGKDGNLRDAKGFDWEQLEVLGPVQHQPKSPERRTNGPMPEPERR